MTHYNQRWQVMVKIARSSHSLWTIRPLRISRKLGIFPGTFMNPTLSGFWQNARCPMGFPITGSDPFPNNPFEPSVESSASGELSRLGKHTKKDWKFMPIWESHRYYSFSTRVKTWPQNWQLSISSSCFYGTHECTGWSMLIVPDSEWHYPNRT